MDETIVAPSVIAWLAFAIGLVLGFVANKTNFCTMGAVSDAVNMGDWSRMRMWMLAMAVAIFGTAALQAAGLFDTAHSIYTGARLNWLSHLVGGGLFGVGMTLASGCGNKTLVRIGGGNLKSVVVFVFLALAAYMTMRGAFAPWRVNYLDAVGVEFARGQDIPSLLAPLGLAPQTLRLVAAATIGGILLVGALASRHAWQRDVLLGGLVVGIAVVAGWYVTGHIGYVAEHPDTLEEAFIGTDSRHAESLTFVAPLAYTLEQLMLWTDASRIVTFGIATVLGVILGSALYAIATGRFRLETFRDPADFLRHAGGAVLMGFGGVTALGCTIGQGISGISTLALGSFLTTAAIIVGAALTMKVQYWLMLRGS